MKTLKLMITNVISQLATTAAALLLVSYGNSALAYDVALDFSPTQNPNGVWSYGYSLTLGGNMILYTDHGTGSGVTATVDYWRYDLASGAPAVTHNFGTTLLTNNTGLDYEVWLPGAASFHPGPGGQFSIFRFTAPSDGLYQLTASFWGTDGSGTTTDVHILDNGVSFFDANVNGFMVFTEASASALSLKAGDHIDFAVGYGLDGSYGSDGTGISAQITPVATYFVRPDSAPSVPPIVQAGFAFWAKGAGADGAVKTWLKGGLLEGDGKAAQLARFLRRVKREAGSYKTFELLKTDGIGTTSQVLYLSLNFERGAVYARFLLYRTPKGWVVQDLDFTTKPEALMPWLALAGRFAEQDVRPKGSERAGR